MINGVPETGKPEPRFFFISELIRGRVRQDRGGAAEEIGRLADLEITQNGGYPEVVSLIVGRSFGRPPLEIPFSMVKSIDPHVTTIEVPPGGALKEFEYGPTRTLVKDMVLDKKIIDTDDYEVEIVYDVRLLYAEGKMHVVHADVSAAGMLRRLHFGWLGRLLWGQVKETDLLPWRYVQALPSDLGRFRGDVRLTISREKIADIHPADLADILEELSGEERMAVFDTLDTETAADTLEEVEPRVQRELVASMRRDRLVELLQTMTPAQIADILEILPRIDAQVLRKLLPAETAVKVTELLNEPNVELESIVTNRFLALPATALAGDALSCFRDRSRRYDVIMYVYVAGEDGVLKGAIDIRELIQAEEMTPLEDIMTEQVVTLSPGDTLADAAKEFTDHGFRALPMVDEDHRLLGVITYKDLLAVMK
ncbi:MAG: CBS domain-containing protein [Candidatus Bipolaricaulota bacterium]|nr:CBS domain-containing protein [Candidatus Bipolaricaulota bacterium]